MTPTAELRFRTVSERQIAEFLADRYPSGPAHYPLSDLFVCRAALRLNHYYSVTDGRSELRFVAETGAFNR